MSSRGSGAAPFVDAAVTDTPVLASAGPIGLASFFIYNPSNAAVYIRLFDAALAADVTLGTTVPNYILGCNTLEWAQGQFSKPIAFSKGLVYGGVTTAVGSEHTAPNAAVLVNFGLNR
jgi:hypothetical protein